MEYRRMRRDRGFTIVELMIAMTLGLLLGGTIISAFVFNRHAFARDESVLRMQDDARQAVRALATDLSMAGFWADLLLPDTISPDDSLAVGTDCGPSGTPDWIYELGDSIIFVDNATGASASGSFSCILASEIVPGTDVLAIKRLAGASTAVTATNGVYMRTNGTLGLLYKEPLSTSPPVTVPAPFTEWEYRPSIYYVRNFGTVAGDGVPTLCRKVLTFASPPNMTTECLAQGIENLQVEFGLDSNGNGEPNVFVANPTAAELETAVAARIYLLARSIEPDFQYTNEKTYTLGNAPAYAPADNFYRRVYSLTVGMHNLRSLLRLGS